MLRAKTADIKLIPSSTSGLSVAIVTVDGEDLGERLIHAGLAVPEAEYLRGDPQRAARHKAAFTQKGSGACWTLDRACQLARREATTM